MPPRPLPALAAAAALALLPLTAAAQTLDGKGRGLDALDESTVMARMAGDGLTGLLDRDLDAYKVPAAERDQQKAVIQLGRLASAQGLKPADRRALAEQVAKALDPTVNAATDAKALQAQAYQLTAAGIQPTVTELEYFGENPAAQAQLKPVAETVRHMFQRAGAVAATQVTAILNKINNGNFAQLQPQLKAVGAVKRLSEFNYNRTGYALCLSLPPADPARAATADATVAYLRQFDNAKSGIQAGIGVLVGKLQLVKGDYDGAKKALDAVANGAGGAILPAPTAAEQNDARYFAAVADLLAKRFDAAAAGLKDLDTWQQINYLPKLDPGGQNQLRAADAMLDFRIASGRADAAADPEAKRTFNDQAVTILSDLLTQQDDPTLRDLVFDQLVTRIPDQPDFAKLNPLALSALQQQGFDEYNKKDADPVNQAKLMRGIAAARELAGREGQPGVGHAAAVNAAEFVGFALEQKAHDDPAAATAFMDFMRRYPDEGDKSQDAMRHAGAIVFRLHKEAAAKGEPDPVEANLYDTFLPLAINPPFDQKQVALDYADVLRGKGKFLDAVKYYGMVPTADAKHHTAAAVGTLLSLYAALGDANLNLPADQKKRLADQLQAVATDVDRSSTASATDARTDDDRNRGRAIDAVARYDAAISARRDLKDPAKALAWLDGFEDRVAGLSNAKAFDQSALQQRVQAYIALGKTSDATAALVKLLAADPAAGEQMLFELIQQIDHDLDVARSGHDVAAERELASNKAKLTGFLVTYAQTSHDPKTQAQLPAYRLYDADSKRQAADLSDDPAARTADLNAALGQYQLLAAGGATGESAAAVQLGVGLTQFDLGHYPEAVASLGPVMKQVGQPFVDQNGTRVANPQFWETYLKQMRAVSEVAKQKPADAKAKVDLSAVRAKLGGFFVLYGDKTGGPGYHDEFAKLADDLKVPTGTPAGKK